MRAPILMTSAFKIVTIKANKTLLNSTDDGDDGGLRYSSGREKWKLKKRCYAAKTLRAKR